MERIMDLYRYKTDKWQTLFSLRVQGVPQRFLFLFHLQKVLRRRNCPERSPYPPHFDSSRFKSSLRDSNNFPVRFEPFAQPFKALIGSISDYYLAFQNTETNSRCFFLNP